MGRRGAVAVFLLALLARAVVLCAIDGGPSRPLEGDERGYAAVAGSLARGEGIGFTVEGFTADGAHVEKRLLAFRAPLLPLVLAPVHAVSGGSPAALRWACVLLGALAAPLALVVAARVGGERAGRYAGAAVALWPSHLWLSARVLSEPLDAVLLLGGADLLLRFRALAGGATLGLAVLCRPGGLFAAAFGILAFATSAPAGRRLVPPLLALAGLGAVVAPWVARNQLLLGAPVLATTAGVTLLGGNCDGPDMGMYGWSRLDEQASSDRFAERARAWAAADPGRWMALKGWKVVRFLDPDTRSGREDALLKSVAGWLSWGPALLLVLGALWAGRRLREPAWQIGLALLAGHLLTAAVAYGDARMRAPVEPALLALLAAPFLAGGVAKWTARRGADTVRT
jgi:hypothetical protein